MAKKRKKKGLKVYGGMVETASSGFGMDKMKSKRRRRKKKKGGF